MSDKQWAQASRAARWLEVRLRPVRRVVWRLTWQWRDFWQTVWPN